MRTIDGLANKVAATHEIPTAWASYAVGTFVIVGTVTFAVLVQLGSPHVDRLFG